MKYQRQKLFSHIAAVSLVIAGSADLSIQAQSGFPSSRYGVMDRSDFPVAGLNIQLRKISIDIDKLTIKEALKKIEVSSGVKISFQTSAIPNSIVKGSFKDVPVNQAVSKIIAGTGLGITIVDENHIALVASAKVADSLAKIAAVSIQGKVIDSASGKPLQGVTIAIPGTKFGGNTNSSGAYSIKGIPQGKHRVRFQLLGYKGKIVDVDISSSQPKTVDVSLVTSASVLSEVVTTASGEMRRVEVGNDIVSINADSLVRVAPITSFTDMLRDRVPGMEVTTASGLAGSPSRIRIRGTNSMYGNNDPIIVVDGVRISSTQSTGGSGDISYIFGPIANEIGVKDKSINRAQSTSAFNSKSNVMAPSAIDQIDPNAVETIEVLKGPSAVALYGLDAANGVIVVTTKKGRKGASRWSAVYRTGLQSLPGEWSDKYFMAGTQILDDGTIGTDRYHCTLNFARAGKCIQDSLIVFNTLNNKRTSLFGNGTSNELSATLSGGQQSFRYSITPTIRNEIGYVQMSNADIDFLKSVGKEIPGWLKNPNQLGRFSTVFRGEMNITPSSTIALTQNYLNERSVTAPLATDGLGTIAAMPPVGFTTKANQIDRDGSGVLGNLVDFATKTSVVTQKTTTNIQYDINTANSGGQIIIGADIVKRTDKVRQEKDSCYPYCTDATSVGAVGRYNLYDGNENTYSGRANAFRTLSWFSSNVSLRTSVGGDFNRRVETGIGLFGQGIPDGSVSPLDASQVWQSYDQSEARSLGGYVETVLGIGGKFYLPLSMRTDGGSSLGSGSLPRFPRLSYSYLISENQFFRSRSLLNPISTLRLRTAFGSSANQPVATARYRLYKRETSQYITPGFQVPIISVLAAGNTEVKPERLTELELGMDIGLLDDRISSKITYYRKTTKDMLQREIIPTSLGTDMSRNPSYINLGKLLGTGLEVTLDVLSIDRDAIRLTNALSYTTNKSILKKLNIRSSAIDGNIQSFQRYVEGYPINSRWVFPLISFDDANGNGYIESSELLFGDSLAYAGSTDPKYHLSVHNQLAIGKSINIGASISYQEGANQLNRAMAQRNFLKAANVEGLSLSDQLDWAVLNTDHPAFFTLSDKTAGSAMRRVSAFRIESVQFTYLVARSLLQNIKVPFEHASIALAVSNLWLNTNYSGKDPSVRNAMREGSIDDNVVPRPRSWTLTFRVN